MTDQMQLPEYSCHKKVRGARITEIKEKCCNEQTGAYDLIFGDINGSHCVSEQWHTKHKPEVGGYFVVYNDGYQSFSPTEAFEDGYSRVQ